MLFIIANNPSHSAYSMTSTMKQQSTSMPSIERPPGAQTDPPGTTNKLKQAVDQLNANMDKKVTIICQSLSASNPEDTVDRQDYKRRALGAVRSNSNGQASEEEKMGVGRPHAEKTFKQHYEASIALEPTGKTKEVLRKSWKELQHLAEKRRLWRLFVDGPCSNLEPRA